MRYSARDVAIARDKQADVPVILGSATPSLESYAQALNGRYRLIDLKQRAISQAQLPAIELVDLKHIPVDNGLTRPVLQALSETLARGEQTSKQPGLGVFVVQTLRKVVVREGD